MLIKIFHCCVAMNSIIFGLLASILLSTDIVQSASAYPRSSDIFLHVADYGHTAVYVDQFLRAFDVLAYSVLVFTLAFCVFTVIYIVSCYKKATGASRKRTGDEETASET